PQPKPPERGPAPKPPDRPTGKTDFARRGGDTRGGRGPGQPQSFQQRPSGPTKSVEPARPAAPKVVLPADARVITIKPPIVVRELAEQLKQKPFKIIADLMEANVFANVNQAIDEKIAEQICVKYGVRFEVEKRA